MATTDDPRGDDGSDDEQIATIRRQALSQLHDVDRNQPAADMERRHNEIIQHMEIRIEAARHNRRVQSVRNLQSRTDRLVEEVQRIQREPLRRERLGQRTGSAYNLSRMADDTRRLTEIMDELNEAQRLNERLSRRMDELHETLSEATREQQRDSENDTESPDDETNASQFLRHYRSFTEARESARRQASVLAERTQEAENQLASVEAMTAELDRLQESSSPVLPSLGSDPIPPNAPRILPRVPSPNDVDTGSSTPIAPTPRADSEARREREDPTLARLNTLSNDPELDSMHAILSRMSRSDDIPEWWWLSAGLTPAVYRGRL